MTKPLASSFPEKSGDWLGEPSLPCWGRDRQRGRRGRRGHGCPRREQRTCGHRQRTILDENVRAFTHHVVERDHVARTQFATHAETGEPLPETLVAKIIGARNFNQGFSTVEYCASAIVDLDLHLLDQATISTSSRSRRKHWSVPACQTTSSCDTARRISVTSFRPAITLPAIIRISGRKCWMQTASAPLKRPATSLIPRRPSV